MCDDDSTLLCTWNRGRWIYVGDPAFYADPVSEVRAGKNIVMVFTPLACAFDLPALLPIGCGLLSSPVSALPAGGGVVIYYFVRYVRVQSQALMNQDAQIIDNLTLCLMEL